MFGKTIATLHISSFHSRSFLREASGILFDAEAKYFVEGWIDRKLGIDDAS